MPPIFFLIYENLQNQNCLIFCKTSIFMDRSFWNQDGNKMRKKALVTSALVKKLSDDVVMDKVKYTPKE